MSACSRILFCHHPFLVKLVVFRYAGYNGSHIILLQDILDTPKKPWNNDLGASSSSPASGNVGNILVWLSG